MRMPSCTTCVNPLHDAQTQSCSAECYMRDQWIPAYVEATQATVRQQYKMAVVQSGRFDELIDGYMDTAKSVGLMADAMLQEDVNHKQKEKE